MSEQLIPLTFYDRHKIARLICGNDAVCDFPCEDCPTIVHREFNRVMAAIEKAGCVVMAKKIDK